MSAIPRGKYEGALHERGRPLSAASVSPEQRALPGFGATYREALERVERERYDRRRCAAGIACSELEARV